jgi:hypothetical protein
MNNLLRQHTLGALEDAIPRSIDTVNQDPNPFHWTRSADAILTSIQRFCTEPWMPPSSKP